MRTWSRDFYSYTLYHFYKIFIGTTTVVAPISVMIFQTNRSLLRNRTSLQFIYDMYEHVHIQRDG
jgi:hypothetical protein